MAPQPSENKGSLQMKLTQGTGEEVKLGSVASIISTPLKSQTPSPVPSSPLAKAVESKPSSKSPSPLTTVPASSTKEKEPSDRGIINIISSVLADFEDELKCYNNSNEESSIEVSVCKWFHLKECREPFASIQSL